MQNTVAPPKSVKKTKEQRAQERLQQAKEKAEAWAKKEKEKAEALAGLQAVVNKVPAAYSGWGVIRTRAWLAVNKKAQQAVKSKRGPSVNRCQELVRQYAEINNADTEALNLVARGLRVDLDKAKMASAGVSA